MVSPIHDSFPIPPSHSLGAPHQKSGGSNDALIRAISQQLQGNGEAISGFGQVLSSPTTPFSSQQLHGLAQFFSTATTQASNIGPASALVQQILAWLSNPVNLTPSSVLHYLPQVDSQLGSNFLITGELLSLLDNSTMGDILSKANGAISGGSNPTLSSDEVSALQTFLQTAGILVAQGGPSLLPLGQNISFLQVELKSPPITAIQVCPCFSQMDVCLDTNFIPSLPPTIQGLLTHLSSNPALSFLFAASSLDQTTKIPLPLSSSEINALQNFLEEVIGMLPAYPGVPSSVLNGLTKLQSEMAPPNTVSFSNVSDCLTALDSALGLALLPSLSSISNTVKGEFLSSWLQSLSVFQNMIRDAAQGKSYPGRVDFYKDITALVENLTMYCNELGISQTPQLVKITNDLNIEATDMLDGGGDIKETTGYAAYNLQKLVGWLNGL